MFCDSWLPIIHSLRSQLAYDKRDNIMNKMVKAHKARAGAIHVATLPADDSQNISRSEDSDNDWNERPQKRNYKVARRHRSLALIPPPSLENLALTLADIPMAAPALARRQMLIVSIGNPGKDFTNTYHNAGHLLARALTTRHIPESWSVHQSKVFMNVSGPEVAKIMRKVSNNARLVVLHDDLEGKVGVVRVKTGGVSAQGHNGIKSIQQTLGKTGPMWWRIGVGIGRPSSKDPRVVADYVLGKMRNDDWAKIEDSVDKVIAEIERLDEID